VALHATVQRVIRKWIRKNPDLVARLERAHAIVRNADIAYDVEQKCWYVESSDGSTYYAVNLSARQCQCPDSLEGKAPRGWCKHLLALAIVGAAEAWELKHLLQPQSPPAAPTRAARTWCEYIGQPLVVRTQEQVAA